MAAVGSDLLDVACDPLPTWSDVTTLEAGSGDGGEGCAETCVPDCYCCCAVDDPATVAAQASLDFLHMATVVMARPVDSRTAAPPDQPPTRL